MSWETIIFILVQWQLGRENLPELGGFIWLMGDHPPPPPPPTSPTLCPPIFASCVWASKTILRVSQKIKGTIFETEIRHFRPFQKLLKLHVFTNFSAESYVLGRCDYTCKLVIIRKICNQWWLSGKRTHENRCLAKSWVQIWARSNEENYPMLVWNALIGWKIWAANEVAWN